MTKRRMLLPLFILSCSLQAAPLWARDNSRNASSAGSLTLSDPLPLREVVLFSSGVGYFGRAGQVGGARESTISLPFRVSQVNDVLKSLVIFDASGGVRPVTFATKDAASRSLSQSGVSVGSDVSLGQLLRQFQGAQVRVETREGRIEGRILSVQTKAVTDNQNRTTQFEILNVLSARGLQSIPLDSVTQVTLLDANLNRQLQENLDTSASVTDDSKRVVQLHFAGGAPRDVRAGYLLETPVWKTSYRLVLDAANQTPPFLQGWGLVENTTDDNWQNVHLSLVSGRPISFIQDLYQPLYIPRPVVAPQVVGSPTPQVYGETVDAPTAPGLANAPLSARAPLSRAASNAGFGGNGNGGNGGGGFGGGFPGGPQGAAGVVGAPRSESAAFADEDRTRRDMAQALAQTASQAQGSERGELFEYAIAQPVSIPKNQAAMVPIVSQSIGGERVSIFNPAASPHVLSGFRLKNNTKLSLAGGPLTVFQDGVYAGDAQIGNVGPGDERLISYAVDGELVPAVHEPEQRSQTLSLVARAGVLTITRRETRTVSYTFRNKGAQPKKVLVQQPIEASYDLVQPTANVEKTADEYRFMVDVPAGKSVDFNVVTQRPISQTIALTNLDLDVLISYAREAKASPALQKALQDLVARRRAIVDLQAQRARLQADLAAIDTEQTRIRQNMAQLDRTSALYKQYVEKLTAQEAQVDATRAKINALQTQEAQAQKDLDAIVDNMTID